MVLLKLEEIKAIFSGFQTQLFSIITTL